ncbi:MAG: TetR/AcrR family transcriptional regulator [Bdellovibrionota bacterium]
MARESAKAAAIPIRTPASDPAAVRRKILTAFSTWARRSGIRAVVMGELATQLRMSAMTLYKHFPSKDDLVEAMVEDWALELAAVDALDWEKVKNCKSVLDVLAAWADAWTASLSRVSPAFFDDLRRDHPAAWDRFQSVIEERKLASAKYLLPLLRPDVDPGAALVFLDRLVTLAADPALADQLGISRQDTVRAALSIWAGGAMKERVRLPTSPPPANIPLETRLATRRQGR